MLVVMTSLPPTTNQSLSFSVGSNCAKVIPYTVLISIPPSLILGSTNPRSRWSQPDKVAYTTYIFFLQPKRFSPLSHCSHLLASSPACWEFSSASPRVWGSLLFLVTRGGALSTPPHTHKQGISDCRWSRSPERNQVTR